MSDTSWFEPKKHGTGAVPCHWKGLVLLLEFMLLAPSGAVIISFSLDQTWGTMVWAFIYAFALTGAFLWVARKKCSGPGRWR